MRGEEPIEFDRLFPVSDDHEDDSTACPACDGTLVVDGPIEPNGDGSGRVTRHCSQCGADVEQDWELVTASVVEGGDDRASGSGFDDCPTCDATLDTVGHFFDHRDGSGRQEHSCTDCAVEIDEWWTYRDVVESDER